MTADPRRRRTPSIAVVLLSTGLLAAGIVAAGCGGAASEDSGAQVDASLPPLIMVSIDTLRADRLPAYGYDGVETPALDALRAESVLFARSFSPSPLTLPAHASMLTGLLPPEHGVRANMGYDVASDRLPYLPRLLREAGYATGGAVSSYVLRGEAGLAAGFDFWDDDIDYRAGQGLTGFQRLGNETLDVSLDWLRSVAAGPFFYFFHLYEPHTPYTAPEPFASRYADGYDAEVASADAIVGRLFDELKRLGVYDRALIVVTSDHGEDLGDHGEQGHGIFIYRSTIEIPLLVKLPGGELAGSTVDTAVGLADLPPTFLELAGAGSAANDLDLPGVSLAELARSAVRRREIYAETYVPRLYFGWSELRSLTDGRWQYIESSAPELYDLVADPDQRDNRIEEERRTTAELRRKLAAYEPKFEVSAEADAETRRRLRTLGYLGGARSTFTGELPPPHTQADLLADLQLGLQAFNAGRFGQAAEALRRLLDKNEHVLIAWEHLAIALERTGRLPEALATYQEALARSDGQPHLAIDTAEVLLKMGRWREAREHAELALGWDAALARAKMAESHLGEGDAAAAEEQARLGLADRTTGALLLILARAARMRDDLPAALDYARQAEQAAGGTVLQGLELLRGDALARQGDRAAAETAFRREIERFPTDPLAYRNLALLYAALGRKDEAVALLDRLLEANPSPAAFLVAVQTLATVGYGEEARRVLARGRERYPRHPALRADNGGR